MIYSHAMWFVKNFFFNLIFEKKAYLSGKIISFEDKQGLKILTIDTGTREVSVDINIENIPLSEDWINSNIGTKIEICSVVSVMVRKRGRAANFLTKLKEMLKKSLTDYD